MHNNDNALPISISDDFVFIANKPINQRKNLPLIVARLLIHPRVTATEEWWAQMVVSANEVVARISNSSPIMREIWR